MHIIQDLHNPPLKPRHWIKIKEILEHEFDFDECKNLKLLTKLKAFDYAEAIQEVSDRSHPKHHWRAPHEGTVQNECMKKTHN